MAEIKSPRVDLTENRDFGDGLMRRAGGMRFAHDIRGHIEFVLSDLVVTQDIFEANFTPYDLSGLFPTGSVELIRKNKKEMELMGYTDEKTCDRCGKKLYPWETCGICEECFDEVEEQVLHRLPWEDRSQQEESIIFE